MPSEVGKGTRTCTDNRTSLANTGLVAKTTESPDSHPFNTFMFEGPSYSSSFTGSTSPKEPASDDGLSLVRENYRTKGMIRDSCQFAHAIMERRNQKALFMLPQEMG